MEKQSRIAPVKLVPLGRAQRLNGGQTQRLHTGWYQAEIGRPMAPGVTAVEERIAQLEAETAALCLQLETENDKLQQQLRFEYHEQRIAQLEAENEKLCQQLQFENRERQIVDLEAEHDKLRQQLEAANDALLQRLQTETAQLRLQLRTAVSEQRIAQLEMLNSEFSQQWQQALKVGNE
jgi:hypothetical protein